VPLLVEGLADSNPNVRNACIVALGRFGEAASPHAEKIVSAYSEALKCIKP